MSCELLSQLLVVVLRFLKVHFRSIHSVNNHTIENGHVKWNRIRLLRQLHNNQSFIPSLNKVTFLW